MSTATLLWILACILIADFITGFFHWLEDTYLTPDTPFLPRIIGLANIEHHRDPHALTRNSFLKRNSVPVVMSLVFIGSTALMGVLNWQIVLISLLSAMGNEVHEWNHNPKPKNALASFLQDSGLIQSRRQHSMHHRKPYDQYYCTLTNITNAILERLKFWRGLEWCIRCIFRLEVKRLSSERSGY